MASIFTMAYKHERSIDRDLSLAREMFLAAIEDDSRSRGIRLPHDVRDRLVSEELHKFKETLESIHETQLREAARRAWSYQHIVEAERKDAPGNASWGTKCVWIVTVSPDEREISFSEFYSSVQTFLCRKPISLWAITFEQRGKSSDDLGRGYHAHMVLKTSWRSKAEAARACLSSFPKTILKVQRPTTSPEDYIRRYWLDYESHDGHKLLTRETDLLWRTSVGLENIYRWSSSGLPALRDDCRLIKFDSIG